MCRKRVKKTSFLNGKETMFISLFAGVFALEIPFSLFYFPNFEECTNQT